ncbi:9461_t:CDS:1, partial [Racocetra persica]
MSPQNRKSVIVLSYAAMWKLYCVVVKNNNFLLVSSKKHNLTVCFEVKFEIVYSRVILQG